MTALWTLAVKGLRHPAAILPYLRARLYHAHYRRMWRRFEGRPHREFYRACMDERAARDPRAAVGGLWDEWGRGQIAWLIAHGLQPEHRVLDIGCGSLRAGLHFIRYLAAGHYTGIDISPGILAAGRELMLEAELGSRLPRLLVNADLRFTEFAGERFDVLWAQSVFTHMAVEDVDECLAHAGAVMQPTSVFYATYFEAMGETVEESSDRLTFRQPSRLLMDRATRYGLLAVPVSGFVHPRGQRLLKMTLRA